jgi:hypothetical protein
MEHKNKHEDEAVIKNLLSLAGRQDPFTVPVDYFENLPVQVIQRIRVEELAGQDGSSFPVPIGYFEELPGRIQSAVFAAELQEEVGTTGFNVPSGYFDTLADRIIAEVAPAKPAVKVRRLNSWISYAAAACITVAVASALVFNQSRNLAPEDHLANVPDQEIVNYLEEHSDSADGYFIKENIDDATGLSVHDNLSQQEIERYLENTL